MIIKYNLKLFIKIKLPAKFHLYFGGLFFTAKIRVFASLVLCLLMMLSNTKFLASSIAPNFVAFVPNFALTILVVT